MFPSTIYICLLAFLFVSGLIFTAAFVEDETISSFGGALVFALAFAFAFFCGPTTNELVAKDYEHAVKELTDVRKSCAERHNEEYCLIQVAPYVEDSIEQRKHLDDILESIKKDKK